MTAKGEPTKLSPADRLARKRAAARLRQQRCRSRKRQAMLEKKRHESEQSVPVGVTSPDSKNKARASIVARSLPTHPHTQNFRMQRPQPIQTFCPAPAQHHLQNLVTPTSGEHIYNCVSFESQRSFEEAQRNSRVQTAPSLETVSEESVPVVSPISSPPRKPGCLVQVMSDDEPQHLVPEEEAAVAAMLSLKSGPQKSLYSTSDAEHGREQPPDSLPSAPMPPLTVRKLPVRISAATIPTDLSTKKLGGKSYPMLTPLFRHSQDRRMATDHSPPRYYATFDCGPPHASRSIPPPPRRVPHLGYYQPQNHPHHRAHAHALYAAAAAAGNRGGYYTPPSNYSIRYVYE